MCARSASPTTTPPPLAERLDALTAEGALWAAAEEGRLRCVACGHRCLLGEGRRGICKVRFVRNGRLRVPWGYVAALQVDPTEKKPFFHVRPGSLTLTFGMLGCDFHCGYCQNWLTSQALRDAAAGVAPREVTPRQLVDLARRHGAELVGSSYNEPLITAEWAVAVFRQAKAAGLRTAFVSNGNATPEVLDYLRPWTDCYKVDLKAFDDRSYRRLGGVLANVLRAIEMLVARSFWVEVVTLVVPGFNDTDEELGRAAEFLAGVSPDIPWHVTAFHPDYKMADRGGTSVETLLRAMRIGQQAGLRYVYAGNRPGEVGGYEDTRCPHCRATLVRRVGFHVLENRLAGAGRCSACGTAIPGLWG
ncbi:MAG: AmmeMemoRadiSam system radical SAM enzyme [Chloroflexi bacterium]|nr:AmmeMemoRadiSam system radical SAM enzyme [Chloroflexota bacterium]